MLVDPRVYNITSSVVKQIFVMTDHFLYYKILMGVRIYLILMCSSISILFITKLYIILDGIEENYAVKLTLAILGPMLGFCIIAGGVLLYLLAYRTRRKRPLVVRRSKLVIDSEIEPSILHFSFSSPTSTSIYPNELRATAAGDSTLKV